MNIVIFQGLRHIGSTPWKGMLSIPAVGQKLEEAQKILNEEKVKVEGQPIDLIGYCEGKIPQFSGHSLTVLEHPVIFAASLAIWETEKPPCDAVMGLSFGEWTAMVAAGCLNLRQGLLTIVKRGEEIGAIGGNSLLLLSSTRLPIKRICALCKLTRGVWLGNLNNSQQGIISGRQHQIAEIQRRLGRLFPNLRIFPINLGGAVHTPLMRRARQGLEKFLRDIKFQKPRFPIICNATGEPETDPERIKSLLLKQMTTRLNFLKTIRNICKLPEELKIYEFCLPPGRGVVIKIIQAELQRMPAKTKTKVIPVLVPEL